MTILKYKGISLYNDKDMVCKVINETGEFEPETTQWWLDQVTIATKNKHIVLDIGAYTGYFTILALQRDCDVWSFEPNERVYDRMLMNINLNVLPFGPNQKPIACSDYDGISSLNTNINSLTSASTLAKTGSYKVVTRRLDDYEFYSRVSAIKMDIEGHEIQALNGAKNLLVRDKPSVVTEALSEEEYEKHVYFFNSIGYNAVRCLDKRNYLWEST